MATSARPTARVDGTFSLAYLVFNTRSRTSASTSTTLRDRWGGWRRGPFTAESRSHVSVYELD
jgi:hypothetical protein